MDDMDDLDKIQQHMLAILQTPIFEPGLPLLPVAGSATPSVIMDDPISLSAIPPAETQDQEDILPYVQKLRDLEGHARSEMTTWKAVHLGHASDIRPSISSCGTKRKASDIESDSGSLEPSSDFDSDDEEDHVAPIDPDRQDRPRLPIYHPGFDLSETVTQQTLGIFNEYITAVIRDGYDDKEANHLRSEILRSKTIVYQKAVKLAVAGDTGVGKSALLNAILGVVNMNIESDSGSACTCVITEFRQSPSTQTAPYTAEVEFFDISICQKLVKDLFMQWFRVKQKQSKDPDDVDDRELDQMNTAQDCLQQLFIDRLGNGRIEHFMATAISAKDTNVLNRLLKWTADIHQTFIRAGEMSVKFESNTPDDLIDQYHPFTRTVPNASFRGKPLLYTPWPLVNMIRVALSSPILQQGVIVADVPGISDTNYFRVDNANRYLQSCDATIIVGKIDRLTDNPSFRNQYMDAYRRRRSGSVILVATRSDDLNEENSSVAAVLDHLAQEQLALVANTISTTNEKVQMIENDMKRNRSEGNIKMNKNLKKEKKRLTRYNDTLEKQRKNILIASRNRQVSSVLGGNYRANTGDDAGAAVFCVSNRMYLRYLRGYHRSIERVAPTMSLDQTQIPAFCSHIYALPSKGRTASLNHFVTVTVPTLLNLIQISCSTTTLARAKHLTEIIQNTRNTLKARLKEMEERFRETDIKLLHSKLADHALQSLFDKQALKNLEKWEQLNANTHRAIVKKYGKYTQKKKNLYMDWNEDLLSPARPSIDAAFHFLIDDSIETYKAQVAQASKEVIRDLDEILKDDPKALACDAYKVCFKDNLKRFYAEINRHVEDAAQGLKSAFIKAHVNAIRLGPDDYFPDAMHIIYETAWDQRGAGRGRTMKDVRCEYLRDKVTGPQGPFSEIADWAAADAQRAIDEASKLLGSQLDDMLRKVQAAFERMKYKKDNDTPEGKRFRTELHLMVDEARRILNGVVQESLDLCKAFK